nr:hypothetical protein [Candidatus Gracilibacteria bacterium]
MKKQYIFLLIIFVLFYMLYLIFSYKYKEYKINSHIEEITKLNQEIEQSITDAENLIEYKNTLAYKNKLLKQEQGLKNKDEKVVYLTDEKKYKKFTDPKSMSNYEETGAVEETRKENDIIDSMSNFEKWNYYIFKKNN